MAWAKAKPKPTGPIYLTEALLVYVGAVLVSQGWSSYLQMVEVLFLVMIGSQLMVLPRKLRNPHRPRPILTNYSHSIPGKPPNPKAVSNRGYPGPPDSTTSMGLRWHFENQVAHRLGKEYHPEGKRTIGIQDELEKYVIRARDLQDGLPKLPSDDPRGEIASLLHTFTSNLAHKICGVPDEDGFIQAKSKGTRHLSRAQFLHSEGEEWDDGSQSETEPCSDLAPSNSARRREGILSKAIYIDEVMERAHQVRTRELSGNFHLLR
ncbi:hypothetical protein BYT27DRAFT_7244405 [Phlegmacium glaucopus]|nr:hypothetical protein BYT27DRAFT_7244405 [Phlegmacium glaucopus]